MTGCYQGVAGGVTGGVLPSCYILQGIVLCTTTVASVRIPDGGLFAPLTTSLASLHNFPFSKQDTLVIVICRQFFTH